MLIDIHAFHSSFASLAQVLYPEEGLLHLSWSSYLIIAIFFTIVLFIDEIPREKREIFSRQNKMNLTQILLIHISFLALLFIALQVISHVIRYLPPWMTELHDLGDAYSSVADLLFWIVALLLFACEKIWLSSGMTESESVEK